MIRIRNKDDFEVYLSDIGTNAIGKKLFFAIPFNCFLKAMYSKLGTAGTVSGNLDVDINDEGSSIFSGNPIRFATTAVSPTYGALTTDPHVFTKGDRVDVTIDVVHGTPGTDLSLTLVFTRSKPARVITGAVEAGVGSGF